MQKAIGLIFTWLKSNSYVTNKHYLCVYVLQNARVCISIKICKSTSVYCISKFIPVAITCVVFVWNNEIWMGIYKPFRFLNPLDHIIVNMFIVLMCGCIFVVFKWIALNRPWLSLVQVVACLFVEENAFQNAWVKMSMMTSSNGNIFRVTGLLWRCASRHLQPIIGGKMDHDVDAMLHVLLLLP